jgi:hypothetical protein
MNQNVLLDQVVPCPQALFAWSLAIWLADDPSRGLVEEALKFPIIAWRVRLYRNEAEPSVDPILPIGGFTDVGIDDIRARMLLLEMSDGSLMEFEDYQEFTGLSEAWTELRRRWKDHEEHRE